LEWEFIIRKDCDEKSYGKNSGGFGVVDGRFLQPIGAGVRGLQSALHWVSIVPGRRVRG